MNVFEELQARGLVAQMTHEDEIKELLNNEKVAFYVGFDATADSLHVGSLLQLIIAKRLQEHGHKPILLVGGATTKIGDPTGKSDMRKMLTDEDIAHNIECFKKQFAKFVDLSGDKALVVNNADWIDRLSVAEFIRLGFNFNVNTMLRADCYATRLENGGLTLGEMCYMPMQSLDFMYLHEKYDCRIQLGGNDQWSNIIGGVELVRKQKQEKGTVFGMTFNLLTTAEGKKMGKTEKGTIWLDENLTSPYELFQYWRNVDDKDVIKCIKMLTFIPLEEIAKMEEWEGSQLNDAKKILAYELTKLIHGEAHAKAAVESAEALFAGGDGNIDMPTTKIEFTGEINILDLLLQTNLAPSKSEGRRLVEQGGISINEDKITSAYFIVKSSTFTNSELIIKKGKKTYHKVTI
ncbi:tyrosine--tRNA ligase [Clostridia bacterium]|nr:tyrosine--tRNA ligase [Clostridia bacterium]